MQMTFYYVHRSLRANRCPHRTVYTHVVAKFIRSMSHSVAFNNLTGLLKSCSVSRALVTQPLLFSNWFQLAFLDEKPINKSQIHLCLFLTQSFCIPSEDSECSAWDVWTTFTLFVWGVVGGVLTVSMKCCCMERAALWINNSRSVIHQYNVKQTLN